jgi:salicylate hydroxylase
MLLGDAAHPPVPYIGQGAMQAMEDVGVLARLLRHHCCDGGFGPFDPSQRNLTAAADDYQALRIPRATRILGSSHTLGKTQQMRADSWVYNLKRELSIKVQVLLYGTLSTMKPGPRYDYAKAVEAHLRGEAEANKNEPLAPATASPFAVSRGLATGLAAATAVGAAAWILLRRK